MSGSITLENRFGVNKMELISLKYAIFVIALLVLYYCFPKKYRWYVLLAGSMAYYVIICKWYVLFIIFTICTTYGSTICIDKLLKKQNAIVKSHKEDWDRQTRKEYKEKGRKKRVAVMLFALLCNFGILAFLKYIPYAGELGLLLPLGISFYTFQSMGYVMDVYREIVEPEKNFLKVALFVSFFPQIIQGPIAIYDKLAGQLYEGHSLRLGNLQKGALLVLWGVMKKLVIADRAVNIINFVMDKPMDFSGTYVFFAAVVYALQLYADFSGGIDIVRGIAELFGITMSTNFNHPYFSRSLTEYWHRWHMTLGDWCRNYIFYPLSISKRFLNFGKWLKPRFGAHISKVLPGCIASVITFIVIGVWHGANMKYLYFGLWNGIVIMLAELFAPVNKKVAGGFFKLTGLREKGIFATIVSVFWTFMLILVGYYFDIAANASTAFHMLFKSVTDFHISELGINNIILNLGACGLDEYDILLLIICTLLWFFISFVEENKKLDMRDFILSRKLPLRWAIIYLGIFIVIIFGYYGPGVNPADFVYMQF